MSVIEHEGKYYILAESSFADQRNFILKQGDTFGIFDRYGDMYSVGTSHYGLFHEGTRFLSQLEFTIQGKKPLLLSANLREENEVITVDLANPDYYDKNFDGRLDHGSYHIFRKKFIFESRYYEQFVLENFQNRRLSFRVGFHFNADFSDIFEMRGMERSERGEFHGFSQVGNSMEIAYTGLDEVTRKTILTIACDSEIEFKRNRLEFDLELAPNERKTFYLTIGFVTGDDVPEDMSFDEARTMLLEQVTKRKCGSCYFSSSNQQFDAWLEGSLSDLYTLLTQTDHGLYPYAGIPWYSTAFGRDGIITALMSLWVDSEIAKGVLKYLAATQATEENAFRDAEPGKIMHETRKGEMAATNEIPFAMYYGTIDATMLFVILAGEYLKRTDDLETLREIWPNIKAAVTWINEYGDLDKDGFVEYEKKSEIGLDNQGWKDSFDSIFYSDGELANLPIALCEVQAYTYDAKIKAAEIAEAMEQEAYAKVMRREAEDLKKKFNHQFWSEVNGTFVLALDGNKRPCDVKSSNAGQCLFSAIAEPAKALTTIDTLLSDDMFSGWGIRTISRDEKNYNPMSYHNGSIWPHDNALIAYGMHKYGQKEGVNRIFEAMMDTSLYMEDKRLPELFCGFKRRKSEGPTAYPVACSPQAWAVASVFMMIQSSLGINIIAKTGTLEFNQPSLPNFLDHIVIHDLKVQSGKVTFMAERNNESVAIKILEKTDDVNVLVKL